MAKSKEFDLAVLGSGPGGYVAAIRAAQLGLKAAIIEREERLGGVCLNWGCIPSKALLTNATLYRKFQEADSWGIQVKGLDFDIDKIISRSRDIAENISKGVNYLMKKNSIEVIQGTGKLVDAGRLSVEGEKEVEVKARHIVIATGARARSVPGVEIDGEKVLTSRHALALREVPEKIVIIGAGAIGCEFGYFYNSFGAQVTMVEMLDHLLPLEDEEVSKELERSFKKQGIGFRLQSKVTGVDKSGSGVRVKLENRDGEEEELETDKILVAVGVQGNVEDIGLEEVGVKVDRGQIQVDEWYRTTAEGIYAIGDVIGPPWLAHVASHEGICCVEKIADANPHPVDYGNIPACTYCQPQVASVGLTEKKAREEGLEVNVGKFPFRVLGKARASGAIEGFVKLIFDARYGEMVGAHIIGEEATELIAELVTAKALETTYLELLKTVHAHPTLSEAVMEAAGAAYDEQIHL